MVDQQLGAEVGVAGLATAIWFFVKGITSDWRVIEGVPLEIKAKPGLTVVQSSASTINVTLRGTREDVRQVSRQELLPCST